MPKSNLINFRRAKKSNVLRKEIPEVDMIPAEIALSVFNEAFQNMPNTITKEQIFLAALAMAIRHSNK